jgi:hypothetical protein
MAGQVSTLRRSHSLGNLSGGSAIKAASKNKKTKQEHTQGTQDFNVKNPLQQREVKTTGASQQNFTISGGIYKRRGISYNLINPSRWLTKGIFRRRHRSVSAIDIQGAGLTPLVRS